jgi:hypothetical protein
MIRKRLAALQRRMSVMVSVVTLVAVITLLSWHRSNAQRDAKFSTGAPQVPVESTATNDGVATQQLVAEDGASSIRLKDGVPVTFPSSHAVDSCIASKKDVLLVGNRPVGTYLCSYFPAAKAISGGCRLPCSGSRGTSPFTCTILNMGSKSQLKSADIVVNHHGPIPTKFSPLEPVITLFYSGESNVSEGLTKKASHSYQTKYDNVVSFHQHRPWYFTWTNRFEGEFRAAVEGTLQKGWPLWQQRRNAVAIFVSRCKKGGRERVIQALKEVYPVHSFGKCMNTHSIEKEFPRCAAMVGRYPQKLCVFSQYKYILALDNTRERDYVTEKVYHALIAGAVPIYDGAPNADAFLPGGWGSVIRLSDFDDGSGGTKYLDLQSTLRSLENADSSPKLDALRAWTKVSEEEAWGPEFVANLHHGEPTCDVCDAARKKKCGSL